MEKIKLCPDSPNCVSSLPDENPDKKIDSFPVYKDFAHSKAILKEAIVALPRTRLLEEQQDFLHFTFTSLIFRFVDDVFFEYDTNSNVIHVRSASRTGYSDLGVNAKRMRQIRELYQSSVSSQSPE